MHMHFPYDILSMMDFRRYQKLQVVCLQSRFTFHNLRSLIKGKITPKSVFFVITNKTFILR